MKLCKKILNVFGLEPIKPTTYATTTDVALHTNKLYDYRLLLRYCKDKDLECITFKPRSSKTRLAYPARAWLDVYNVDISNVNRVKEQKL